MNENAPLDEVEQFRMPLIEHLRELRSRIIRGSLALAVGMAVSLAFTEELYAFLTAPMVEALAETGVKGGLSLVSSPFEGIYTYLRVAFIGGVTLASPFIAYQGWQFIAPGLYKTERRMVLPLAIGSTVLFLLGAGFAYRVIFPVAFPFFLTVIDAEANLSLGGYLTAVIRMMLAFGACFQLPVVTWFLARLGLIDHKDMIGGFRYAVVAIFAIAAIITPPEVLTQVLLAIPLVILYIVGIFVAWMTTTKVRPG